MSKSIFSDIHSKYPPLRSLIYDRLVSPALAPWGAAALGEIGPALAGEPACKVLDVGCGGGQLLLDIAERFRAARLTGVDQSPAQVARSRGRLGEKAQIVEGDAMALPFADASFDVVVSVASIKHWPGPRGGLFECCRVLRPGGRLVVVEGDRGVSFEDFQQFIHRMRFPTPAYAIILPMTRTYIFGRGPDLDDFRAWSGELGLALHRVERIPGTAGILLSGRRA